MARYLEGERVVLRTLRAGDLEELDAVMDDWRTLALTGSVYPNTAKELAEGLERCQDTASRVWFAVTDKSTGKIIGETGFLRIFMPWRTSDFTLELWSSDHRGKGLGTEVAALMFEYGFDYLNLHRLAIGVVDRNEAALRFWKKVGFQEEGRQVQGFYGEGSYSDFVMMYLLEDRYRAMRPGRALRLS